MSEPQGNLWMYGGLSLSEGILGNVYRYSHIKKGFMNMNNLFLYVHSCTSWISNRVLVV